MADGFDPVRQHTASARGLRIEVFSGDATILGDEDASENHPIATGLTYIAGGWLCCNSATAVTMGCVSSQMRPTDHSFGASYVEFTMEESCAGYDSGVLFGW